MASYEKPIEHKGKWNKLSLKAGQTNQSRMSDTQGNPSMGEASHTERIWRSHCWYKGSLKAGFIYNDWSVH